MTIIAVIALTSCLAVLTALAVFAYFGAYWRMVWRQNRNPNRTAPSQSINFTTLRKSNDLSRNHSPRPRIRI